MKKLKIVVLAFSVIMGMSQFSARCATNSGVLASENRTAVKMSGLNAAGQVKPRTKTRFNQDFGRLTKVVWEKSGKLDKATYMKDGSRKVAFYNPESRLVGTGSAGSVAGLPDQMLAGIKGRYKDYSIGQVIFFDRNEANTISKLVYGTRLKEENYLVELLGDGKKIIVQVRLKGESTVFNQI